MAAQAKPTQDLTLSEKMKIVQYLSILPAITIMVFIRRRIGFRMLKPSRLIGMAMFLWFINDLSNINFLIFHPAGFWFSEFPLVMLIFAFFQRWRRWSELCKGVRWHTLSPGISYFELLPLPSFLTAHRRIYRFLEPFSVFIFSMFFGVIFSEALARWFAISAFFLFIYEQTLFEKQLDRDLDILDGLVAADVQAETVEHFAGPQPEAKQRTLQDTAGIPTGVAFDIHRQIEKRRAEQALRPDKLNPDAPIRQYVVNVLPGGDNFPPGMPERLVKDAPDNPA